MVEVDCLTKYYGSFAAIQDRPVIGLESWRLHEDRMTPPPVRQASSPDEAVRLALEAPSP